MFSVEADTAAAVLSCAGTLRTIAVERILAEWNKLLCGSGAEEVLCAFPQVFKVFLEELRPLLENPAAWRRAVARVCSAPRERYLRTALLFLPERCKLYGAWSAAVSNGKLSLACRTIKLEGFTLPEQTAQALSDAFAAQWNTRMEQRDFTPQTIQWQDGEAVLLG